MNETRKKKKNLVCWFQLLKCVDLLVFLTLINILNIL